MKATLHTDGGARGNPGPAGIGCYLQIARKEPIEFKEYIGETTNNQAEYQALLAGMRLARDHGVDDLACFLDSELVVKQLSKEYRVKDPDLKVLYRQVCDLMDNFAKVAFLHVRREKNKEADQLVNEAIDEALG